MRRRQLLVLTLVGAACNAKDPRLTPSGPVTSAGDPAEPVPFEWSVHTSQQPDGHVLQLRGGTLHAVPSELRLLDRTGRVVSGGPAAWVADGGPPLCDRREGVTRADLPLPAAEVANFRADWPAGYRLEARVGGGWRVAQLTFAGCRSND